MPDLARDGNEPSASVEAIVVGPLPPPVHGAALVTSHIVELLRRAYRTEWFDTASTGTGLKYHAGRFRAHVKAISCILRRTAVAKPTVYVGGAGGHGLWYQVIVVLFSVARRCPVVFHHHSYAYLVETSRAIRLLSMVQPVVHIALAEDMRRRLLDMYNIESVVISNAAFIPGNLAAAETPIPSAVVLGHFGNLSREKGLLDVLQCFEACLDRGLPVKLSLAGPMKYASDKQAVAECVARHPGRVLQHGALDRADVPGFLQSLDLFLFPSSYVHEAQPLVLLEAMAAGVPIVAHRRGALEQTVGECGLVVEPGDEFVAAVSELCGDLLKDAGRHAEMRRNCRAKLERDASLARRELFRIFPRLAHCATWPERSELRGGGTP